MTDFLDEKRREINDRLAELKPLVDEYERLESAASALSGIGGSASPAAATPARRRSGRPRGSKTRTATARRAAMPPRKRGRRKGSGARSAQALAFITGAPGITIPELADKMGIKQPYLYRVLPELEQEKKIVKKGRGWHPKG